MNDEPERLFTPEQDKVVLPAGCDPEPVLSSAEVERLRGWLDREGEW